MEDNTIFLDFNANFGQYSDSDAADRCDKFIPLFSSINITCGFHAGTPLSIKRTIEHCKFKNKVIGALIGLPDKITDPLNLSAEEVESIVLYQLGALSSFAKAYSLNIEQVRPDGIMYDLARDNKEFSIKIANAIKKFNKWFIYVGSACQNLKEVSDEVKINTAAEFIINNDSSIDELREKIKANNLPDTLHFDLSSDNADDLIKKVTEIVKPRPVNFNNVVSSGWVD